jgi:type II secretory ATPase GspE/PulE/Tfp pilus assembly ATPase PilB-like protein
METSLLEKPGASPPFDCEGEGYTAHDLALCSTEEARALLSYENAVRMRVLPLAILRGGSAPKLHCVLAERSEEVLRGLRFLTDLEPLSSLCDGEVVDEAVVKAYRGHEHGIWLNIEKLSKNITNIANTVKLATPHASGDSAQFLNVVLEFAVARGASDLHLCPSSDSSFLRLRIDGELLTQEEHHYPTLTHEQMVSRLKVLAGLDIACKHLPQDGSCVVPIGNTAKSIRLSTLPTVHGESVVIRFLYARTLPRLTTLGMEPATMGLVRTAIKRTSGVVLLTGPTGSGKTTTMYSIALELQHRGRNVVTVEDPVEAPLPGMVQVQVNEGQGLDYPRAIRSVLRHDPDVIAIGEMRDPTSAKMGITAALTGHLTISSLHMGSALQALERLRSFDLSARDAVEAVSLVVNQRLTPRLCSKCKTVDLAGTERFKRTVYKPAGCSTCGDTGFNGRVLITETLDLLSPTVKEAYSRAHTIREAMSLIPSSAFVPWTQALEFHLSRGDLSAQQVQEFVDEEMVNE